MIAELQSQGFRYYLCDLSAAISLSGLPWRNDAFDVSMLIFDKSLLSSHVVMTIIEDLVSRNTDWFSIHGIGAEQLHDDIDLIAVRLGRQKKVGEGSPMTAWDEEIVCAENIAEDLITGDCGGCDYKVVVILGTSNDFTEVVDAMKKAIENEQQDMLFQ
jgi:hypothetical protein